MATQTTAAKARGSRSAAAGKTRRTGRASTSAKGSPPRKTRLMPFQRVAKPDAFDERDIAFRPNISLAPKQQYYPRRTLTIKNQGDTNACTGFALSTVVEYLLGESGRENQPAISPFMLYSMARRYDEFAGHKGDNGSSLRGALKGWFKHGACEQALFPAKEMPPASSKLQDDWWLDAVKRPLGAYYRIDTSSISAMHAAINEVGILYASAGCHPGWNRGAEVENDVEDGTPLPRPHWIIPQEEKDRTHLGHAFAIIGYTELGFIIQNSWGQKWGTRGLAVLTYDDWLRNAMDCWVVQLGVVTREHTEISESISLRTVGNKVTLAAGEVLRNREISPFIVNVGNDGRLSSSGEFRTTPDDVRAIVDVHLPAARKLWGMESKALDVCVYAHGGLVSEASAARIAAEWIPLLYEQQIFPVFIMWETDFITTVMNILKDKVKLLPIPTGGIRDTAERYWNERLEGMLARPGTVIWQEMKENAKGMSQYKRDLDIYHPEQAAMVMLYHHFHKHVAAGEVRLHIVGHSAGAIVASHFVSELANAGGKLESLSLMAPAVREDDFRTLVVPHLKSRRVKRYQQMHLTDRAEEDDPTCGPYLRSLLYLVSESFEGGVRTELLGMDKYFSVSGIPCDKVFLSPSGNAAAVNAKPPIVAASHGGFDNDEGARQAIVRFIKQ